MRLTVWCSGVTGSDRNTDIDQLRAIFPNANIIAVTATATVAMQQEIARLLNMINPLIVIGQSSRHNIKYTVKRQPSHTGKCHTLRK